MDPRKASKVVQFKVGIFTVLALLLVGAATVFVNDRPFWWRPCQLVFISVDDATGLKTKSPVRSLGLQIGYLSSVQLMDSKVRLGICVTAQVEVTPSTRAYIRGEGFLGDKFVELKPVKYVGPVPGGEPEQNEDGKSSRVIPEESEKKVSLRRSFLEWIIPSAHAEEKPGSGKKGRDIPVGSSGQDVQEVVNQVNNLVTEVTSLTHSLKQAIKPEELRSTMQQLNRTLENASRTLSPEGNLNTTAQRTLAKLEDAIEQLRDMAIRINKGEGSVGMLLNDPYYAEGVKELLKNANRLLTKVGGIRFVVDVGAVSLPAGDGSRGALQLVIWPREDRYYKLGVAVDSARGRKSVVTTTTVSGGASTEVKTTSVDESGLLFTAMFGKVFRHRLDLSLGILHSDGTVSAGIYLGPKGDEERFRVTADIYSLGKVEGITSRVSGWARVYQGLYVTSGMESLKQFAGKTNYFYGAGVSFDDEDIKILFAFR
ncbi:MAG: MCE family protein [Bdellovibrionales bacterium]|nr:MCE family protein [Bdellovibrionales bacterium]